MATNPITAPRTPNPTCTTYGINSVRVVPKLVIIGSNEAVPHESIMAPQTKRDKNLT